MSSATALAKEDIWTQLPGIALALVLLVALGLVFLVVARYLRGAATGKDGSSTKGLSSEDVEALYRRGALTEQEYRRARRAALGLPPDREDAEDRSAEADAAGSAPQEPENR